MVIIMDKLTELSREISYVLRHAPWEYELEMDEEGWISIEQLLDAFIKTKNGTRYLRMIPDEQLNIIDTIVICGTI